MQLSRFLSARLRDRRGQAFSALAARIAVWTVALGIALLICSVAILRGFQNEIRDLLFRFEGHIQVTRYDLSASDAAELPIRHYAPLFAESEQMPHVERVQAYTQKYGLLKQDDQVMGVLFKGIEPAYRQETFTDRLVAGEPLTFVGPDSLEQVLLSQTIADRLRLKVGDKLRIFFIQDKPKERRLVVQGIYHTGLEELDEHLILGNMAVVQQLNGWNDSLVGGFEVFVKDLDQFDLAYDEVWDLSDPDVSLMTVRDKYLAIFDWLAQLNQNVWIFLVFVFGIVSFAILSTLFILMKERTQMIGLFKAFGATNQQLSRLFVWMGLRLAVKGLIIGNLLGLLICWLQDSFQLIPLDPEHYFMEAVPIDWPWALILMANGALLVFILLVLLIPANSVARLRPIQAIRFQ